VLLLFIPQINLISVCSMDKATPVSVEASVGGAVVEIEEVVEDSEELLQAVLKPLVSVKPLKPREHLTLPI